MTSGITSTARPTVLRLAGTACVALGAIAAGVGATREWATIGFTADVEHAADVSVHGIDVWEGKVVLFAAVAALLVMLAMRISGSRGTRRGLAIALIVLGGALRRPAGRRRGPRRRTVSAASRAWTGSRRRSRCSSGSRRTWCANAWTTCSRRTSASRSRRGCGSPWPAVSCSSREASSVSRGCVATSRPRPSRSRADPG